MYVCLLLEAKPADHLIVTGCGQRLTRKTNEPMPTNVSAWASKITCPDCLARRRQVQP